MEAIRSEAAGRRAWALVAALVLPLLALPFLPPIVQDPNYHHFVDARSALGITNFGNVASNLAFLIVGLAGIRLCLNRPRDTASLSWLTFFVGVTLVAFGSSYYHLSPNDGTLVWDRLPMTIAFMALFSALVGEHLDVTRQRTLLTLTIAAGVASVVWWRMTGDLKPYVWVQVAPFLAIAVLLALFQARYSARFWLAWGLAFYMLAKVAEFSDARIYEATSHAISGHSLKHLLAALAPLCVYLMLVKRSRTG